MRIIRETHRKLINLPNYKGVCHACNSPIEYDEEFIAIVIDEKENYMRIIPIDIMACPHCFTTLGIIGLTPNMDIQEELAEIEKHDKI